MATKPANTAKKSNMGRPRHQPTKESRDKAKVLAGYGLTREQISTLLGINKTTLLQYYADDLATGEAEAAAIIAGAIFKDAKAGDTTLKIWWSKARMGWYEKKQHEVTGKDGAPLSTMILGGLRELDPDEFDQLKELLGKVGK